MSFGLDYKTKIPFHENPLWLLRLSLIEIGHSKFISSIVIFSLAVNSVVRVIEFYYFWDNVSFLKLVQFGPAYFGYIYVMTVAFLMILYQEDVEKYAPKEVDDKRFSIYSAGPEIRTAIYKRAKQTYIYICICIVMLIVTAICMLIEKEAFIEFHYILNLVHNRWKLDGSAFLVFGFAYNIICGPIACSVVYHPVLTQYLTQQMTYQAMMLIEHIRKVTRDFEHLDESGLFNDGEYQQVMHERLIFCAKWHIEFRRFLRAIDWPSHYAGGITENWEKLIRKL